MKTHKKPKVAIVYQYIAHYRKSIFQRLSGDGDVEFTVISGRELDMSIKVLDPAIASEPVDQGGLRWMFVRNKWLAGRLLWQSGLDRELRDGGYDAVIFLGNAYYLSTWVQAVRCKLRGVKVMMWGHGFLREEAGLKGLIRKTFYKLASTHFVYSNRSIGIMRRMGLASKRFYQVNNSLDYPVHLALRDVIACSEDPYEEDNGLKLIFVGRLTSQKKLSELVEAHAELRKKGIPASVYFIGDGNERDALERLADSLGTLESIHFMGAIYDEEKLAQYIYHADICVSPGEVGLTAIHAMSFGTPVISHDNFDFQMPEFESIIDGKTGAFFKQGSITSLTDCIESFAKVTEDRESVRRNCLSMIDDNFTPEYQCTVFKKGIFEALADA